jgi:hypothetical protein
VFKTAFFRSVGVWWRGKAANGEIMQSREPAFESLRASCLGLGFFRLAIDWSSRSSPESMGFGEAVKNQVYKSMRQEIMERRRRRGIPCSCRVASLHTNRQNQGSWGGWW